MRKFLKISIVLAIIMLIIVVAMSLQEQGTIRKFLVAQATASFMTNLQTKGIVEQTPTGIQVVPTKTEAAPTPQPEPATPPPSWCQPPSVYSPLPPRPGTPNSPPGLCITESPLVDGKQSIKYCSIIGRVVMCYIVKIDCSVVNQACKIDIKTPWGDIPSMFLPPAKCENLPAQPYDPSGVYRVKCTMDPSIYPQPIELCYKIDPKTRGMIPMTCPTPPVKPINPMPVQPTTPPNRDDAFPPVVPY